MNFYLPWTVTAFFGLCAFCVGLYFQRAERERRRVRRAAERHFQSPGYLTAFMASENERVQASRPAPSASSAAGAGIENQERMGGLN